VIEPHVSIRLESTGPLYTYKNHIEGLAKDDVVAVCLPSGKFTCGHVESLKPSKTECAKATKYVVAKVDLDTWRALTALDPPPERDDKELRKKLVLKAFSSMITGLS
jgi:hypothetical protein